MPSISLNAIMIGTDVTTLATGNLPSIPPPAVAAVQYANPAAGDYQHAPGSPAIDQLPYTGKADIDGRRAGTSGASHLHPAHPVSSRPF